MHRYTNRVWLCGVNLVSWGQVCWCDVFDVYNYKTPGFFFLHFPIVAGHGIGVLSGSSFHFGRHHKRAAGTERELTRLRARESCAAGILFC